MKKSVKTILAILFVALVIVFAGVFIIRKNNARHPQMFFTTPDGSTVFLTPEESEMLSVRQSMDVLGSQRTIVRHYLAQKNVIKNIAEFIFQYPMRTNETIGVSNYEEYEMKIWLNSMNRPAKDITDEVDKDFMSSLKELFSKNDFFSVSSNAGGDFVVFTAAKTGFKKCNGIIIAKDETKSKEEAEEIVRRSSIIEAISAFELIDENVYYFEVK